MKNPKQKAIEEAKKLAEAKRKESMTPDDIMIEEISQMVNDTDTIAKKAEAGLSGRFGKAVYQTLKDKIKEHGHRTEAITPRNTPDSHGKRNR